MWACAKAVIVLCALHVARCQVPPYLKPCSKSAKDFKACCVAHGNEALPTLLKGDPKFNIPNLTPLQIPRIDVATADSLKIVFLDVSLLGLDSAKLTDMSVDFDAHKIELDIFVGRVSIIGNYEVGGKILILPLEGKGPANVTADDGKFKYKFNYKLENRNGINYAIIQDDDQLTFEVGHAYFRLDNLFNGNKQMSDNVNNFLNENWEEVTKELGGAIQTTIAVIARRVGGGVLSNLPFDNLFLP
ncbi:protein takeout-like isoform X2 [Cylas formicarius]|uniref:protein takeout-like isoform X2 n=1 Tax=Cylas formicarius TaxID=197179 RepID=UPI002958CCF5|nr:protein takeout-like isoform X2 [Cylas formicarius]